MTNVSINDLELILTGARAIQDSDGFRKQLETTDLSELDNLQGIYGIAEQYGISQENVNKYLAIYFPSEEKQFETLKNIDAKPSFEVVVGNYSFNLLKELRKTFPAEEFTGTKDCQAFYKINRINKKNLFNMTYQKTKKTLLADIDFDDYGDNGRICVLNIRHPLFTIACADKIKELQKRFENSRWNIKKITYNYPVV
jgi:hypothetical protein